MQASNSLAEKAQLSTEKMESMTKEMHGIARKTQVETVSMRIITLVTLFFLPGTFISVRPEEYTVLYLLTQTSDADEYAHCGLPKRQVGLLFSQHWLWCPRVLHCGEYTVGMPHIRGVVSGVQKRKTKREAKGCDD
jgi:hypothetical protein